MTKMFDTSVDVMKLKLVTSSGRPSMPADIERRTPGTARTDRNRHRATAPPPAGRERVCSALRNTCETNIFIDVIQIREFHRRTNFEF